MNWLRHLREAPIASALIALNVAVYVAMSLAGEQAFAFEVETLIRAGANVWPGAGGDLGLPEGTVTRWRWLTAAFIHVNLIHAAMNLMVLVQIGIVAERLVGGGVLAAAYVTTGVAGNVLSTALASSRAAPLLSAGASGAIMGLLGMVAVLAWVASLRPLAKLLLRNAAFVIGLGIVLSLSGRGFLDNGAHVGGLVAGAALGWVRSRIRRPTPRWLNRALVAVAFAVVAIAFLVVLRTDRAPVPL